MKKVRCNAFLLVLILTLAVGAARAALVSNRTVCVRLDERAGGAIVGLKAADGLSYEADGKSLPLFRLEFARPDDLMKTNVVTSAEAREFACEPLADGLRLTYRDLGPAEEVVCTVRSDEREGKLRWGISVRPRDGWALCETDYPQILCRANLHGNGDYDSFVSGHTKGGRMVAPGRRMAVGKCLSYRQPGELAAQFCCFYTWRSLLYFGTEDAQGRTKGLSFARTADGLALKATRYGWETGLASNGYDVVTATIGRTGDRGPDWRDAADLYRQWAARQRWCATRFDDRTDLPEWMRDAPVMVRFHRNWLKDPEKVRAWMRKFRELAGPKTPVLAAIWGWEKVGYWVTPDYFPPYPDEATFRAVVRALRDEGAHLFLWPSGYSWTLTYGRREDGTFDHDSWSVFERIGRSHARHRRDGALDSGPAFWLKGGSMARLCGGDAWSRQFFCSQVVLPLAKYGSELLQIDQVVGGGYAPCWATNHGHEPGDGDWKYARFREQLVTARQTMRSALRDTVVCFEEPNEQYLDVVGIQDYRDCECGELWASVFNYLYHDYVPCFQSNMRPEDPEWWAWSAADGQIPFVNASPADFTDDPVARKRLGFLRRWIAAYRGEGRDFLPSGRAVRPPSVSCGYHTFSARPIGNVLANAFAARDGRRAVMLVNTTGEAQAAKVALPGGDVDVTLAPYDLCVKVYSEVKPQKGDGK